MMGRLKAVADRSARLAEASGCVALLERTARKRRHTLHALMYHRIADPEEDPALYPGLISATPREFEAQMEHLARHNPVVSVEALQRAVLEDEPLPHGAVLLTFDDAYSCFADHAWPVMKRLGLPCVVFVPTGFADDPELPFWWDRLYQACTETKRVDQLAAASGVDGSSAGERVQAFRRLRDQVKARPHDEAMAWVDEICSQLEVPRPRNRVLRWPALRQLATEGVTLCPHTRTHPLLNRISSDRVRAEVRGAREDLEREIGPTAPVLAYPSGGVDDAAVAALEDEAYTTALTTARGVADVSRHHPLRLPRLPVTRPVTRAILRVQLLPQYAHLNPVFGVH